MKFRFRVLVISSFVAFNMFYVLQAKAQTEYKIAGDDLQAGDRFGRAVSIGGDYAIVGATSQFSTPGGAAYIFKQEANGWAQDTKLTPNGEADNFGYSVSLSGRFAIVGAPSKEGRAFIYERVQRDPFNPPTWEEVANLTNDCECAFGADVSIQGNYAVVSGIDPLFLTGRVFIFRRIGTNWSHVFTIFDPEFNDIEDRNTFFGWSVSNFGSTVIVGAPKNLLAGDVGGSAYIYRRFGQNWFLDTKLNSGNLVSGFGRSVSMFGNFAIVGQFDFNYNPIGPPPPPGRNATGSATIYRRTFSGWQHHFTVSPSDGFAGSRGFGSSVSIAGNMAIVAAERDFENGANSGSAYVFRRSGNTWPEITKLKASDGDVSDQFGNSVGITADCAIVGAHFDDDDGAESGSAYIYCDFPSTPITEGSINIPICCREIPDPGGPVIYRSRIINRSRDRIRVTRWVELLRPDGRTVHIQAPRTRILRPRQRIIDRRRFFMPGFFPAGRYELTLFWENGRIQQSETAVFEKISGRAKITADGNVPFLESTPIPETTALEQNYPNPFNPTTQLSYSLNQDAHVTLTVYNVLGQDVVTLVDGTQSSGIHSITWDGTDYNGQLVAGGVYIQQLIAIPIENREAFIQTRKMFLAK